MSELSHRKAVKLIQGNHLSSHERDALAAHLTGCEACRSYLAMHLHLSQNLQLEPARTWPPPELRAALRRRVYNQHRRNQIMKPIQVLAGVATLIILIAAGWMLFGNDSPQVEPAVLEVEATIAPTQEAIVIVEPEMPTEAPVVMPTETAVPPTQTPVPPLPTATLAPANITTVGELAGYWQRSLSNLSLNNTRNQDVYHFRVDGILEVAVSLADLEAGEVKARANYWFEDGLWQSQITSGIWTGFNCYSGTGKPGTGRYEIRPVEDGTIRFLTISDPCTMRVLNLTDDNNTLTMLDLADEDWFTDTETGLPLNPGEFPADSQFVLVGTMLNLDASNAAAPVVMLRLPSGQVVEVIAPPLSEITIDGEVAPDLAAYDPLYPVRARLLVQVAEDGSLQAVEMLVLTTLQ